MILVIDCLFSATLYLFQSTVQESLMKIDYGTPVSRFFRVPYSFLIDIV